MRGRGEGPRDGSTSVERHVRAVTFHGSSLAPRDRETTPEPTLAAPGSNPPADATAANAVTAAPAPAVGGTGLRGVLSRARTNRIERRRRRDGDGRRSPSPASDDGAGAAAGFESAAAAGPPRGTLFRWRSVKKEGRRERSRSRGPAVARGAWPGGVGGESFSAGGAGPDGGPRGSALAPPGPNSPGHPSGRGGGSEAGAPSSSSAPVLPRLLDRRGRLRGTGGPEAALEALASAEAGRLCRVHGGGAHLLSALLPAGAGDTKGGNGRDGAGGAPTKDDAAPSAATRTLLQAASSLGSAADAAGTGLVAALRTGAGPLATLGPGATRARARARAAGAALSAAGAAAARGLAALDALAAAEGLPRADAEAAGRGREEGRSGAAGAATAVASRLRRTRVSSRLDPTPAWGGAHSRSPSRARSSRALPSAAATAVASLDEGDPARAARAVAAALAADDAGGGVGDPGRSVGGDRRADGGGSSLSDDDSDDDAVERDFLRVAAAPRLAGWLRPALAARAEAWATGGGGGTPDGAGARVDPVALLPGLLVSALAACAGRNAALQTLTTAARAEASPRGGGDPPSSLAGALTAGARAAGAVAAAADAARGAFGGRHCPATEAALALLAATTAADVVERARGPGGALGPAAGRAAGGGRGPSRDVTAAAAGDDDDDDDDIPDPPPGWGAAPASRPSAVAAVAAPAGAAAARVAALRGRQRGAAAPPSPRRDLPSAPPELPPPSDGVADVERGPAPAVGAAAAAARAHALLAPLTSLRATRGLPGAGRAAVGPLSAAVAAAAVAEAERIAGTKKKATGGRPAGGRGGDDPRDDPDALWGGGSSSDDDDAEADATDAAAPRLLAFARRAAVAVASLAAAAPVPAPALEAAARAVGSAFRAWAAEAAAEADAAAAAATAADADADVELDDAAANPDLSPRTRRLVADAVRADAVAARHEAAAAARRATAAAVADLARTRLPAALVPLERVAAATRRAEGGAIATEGWPARVAGLDPTAAWLTARLAATAGDGGDDP